MKFLYFFSIVAFVAFAATLVYSLFVYGVSVQMVHSITGLFGSTMCYYAVTKPPLPASSER